MIWVGYMGMGVLRKAGFFSLLLYTEYFFHIWAGSSCYYLYYIMFDFWATERHSKWIIG